MKTLKKLLKGAGIALGVLLLLAGVAYGWASWKTSSILDRTIVVHEVDIPVPFPLSEAETEGLDPSADLEAIALERAIERGRHLVDARYACVECHGRDFGGGTMLDDPMIGRLLGPNLTTGRGSRTLDYTTRDWERIVRHGVRPDGRPSAMPSEDFLRMTDQELSDIIAYIRSRPAVDREIEPVSLGPIGTVLIATGALPLSVDRIGDHASAHALRPPAMEPTVELGEHLVGVCTGCHRPTLEGGPNPAGPPDWLPAANLTPHADGLASWTREDFVRAMRHGTRPDGTRLGVPMSQMLPYGQAMTDVELQAMWAYLRTVEPRPDPE